MTRRLIGELYSQADAIEGALETRAPQFILTRSMCGHARGGARLAHHDGRRRRRVQTRIEHVVQIAVRTFLAAHEAR